MDRIDWLTERLSAAPDHEFLVWNDTAYTCSWLTEELKRSSRWLEKQGVGDGAIVSIRGDFSPHSIALLLALVAQNAIVVPLASGKAEYKDSCEGIAEVGYSLDLSARPEPTCLATGREPRHLLLRRLTDAREPGLILFSSGSTGQPKAALHRFIPLFERHQPKRPGFVTLAFLLFDHIGGINTLLHALAHRGKIVVAQSHAATDVCSAIAKWRVELLPTTPSFLNILLLSGCWRDYDLSSLRRITYGTEPMPASTLKALAQAFPGVVLQQTYGLSELGILQSKSRDNGSLWVQIGGKDFETQVREGILWIRSRSAMLGYLNAASPFDAEGWFNTGDQVEVDGEWLLIKGRVSDIINIGGLKVYPAEVESVLLDMPEILDATVRAERNPLMGQVVAATVTTTAEAPPDELRRKIRLFCRDRLKSHEIPVKISICQAMQHNDRHKRIRKSDT